MPCIWSFTRKSLRKICITARWRQTLIILQMQHRLLSLALSRSLHTLTWGKIGFSTLPSYFTLFPLRNNLIWGSFDP